MSAHFKLHDLPPRLQAQVVAQLHHRDTGPAPIMESDLRDAALGEGQAEGRHTGPVFIRVTSFRLRLLDEDNLCEKYHVDCLRYAGIISGDDPSQARIETGQQKVRRKDQERVLIEVFPLSQQPAK